ncbi:HAD family hydrolase [Paeniroseomonas aquatica]|uniref:HAD family hydrolase n=1 Tax=Paeniroseomonas aquatica TaxID=373043 RepID=UPI003619A3B4
MRLTDFKVLTFDCYGTLIDWESGIFAALQPLLARLPAPPGRDAALEAFGAHESRQQAATPGMVYSELLAVVHGRLATLWGAAPDPAADAAFGASVPDWPAFPDSAEALAYLKQHFRLVILSNVDRTGFAASNRRLGVEFDLICTAQDVGSYKPDPANSTTCWTSWPGSASAARISCIPRRACSTTMSRRPRPGWPAPGSTGGKAWPAGAPPRLRRRRPGSSSTSPAWPRWSRPTGPSCARRGSGQPGAGTSCKARPVPAKAVRLPMVVSAIAVSASVVKKPWWAVISTLGKVSSRAKTSSCSTWPDRSSKNSSLSSS